MGWGTITACKQKSAEAKGYLVSHIVFLHSYSEALSGMTLKMDGQISRRKSYTLNGKMLFQALGNCKA